MGSGLALSCADLMHAVIAAEFTAATAFLFWKKKCYFEQSTTTSVTHNLPTPLFYGDSRVLGGMGVIQKSLLGLTVP